MPRDYYQVMGLTNNAGPDEIKKAYRRLARQYHPDLHPGIKKPEMEKKFKELNEAYELLNDEEKRKQYDKFGFKWKEAEAYQQAEEEARARQGGRTWERVYTTGEGSNFSDLFENLFGQKTQGEGRGARGFAASGANLEATVHLTLREVLSGTTRRIELPGPSGIPQTLDIRIPKGIQEGERVRVRGKGAPGFGGGQAGDLYLRVHLESHPVFQRQGSNLIVHLPIWPWECALGGEVQVPTISGPVQLKIPPGSPTNRKMRLKGKGLPDRAGTCGDQIVVLDIVLPDSLSKDERDLYTQLKNMPHPDPRSKLMREASHG